MKFIKKRCSKCGYEFEIPEQVLSVICGSCGEINRFGKISTILKAGVVSGTGSMQNSKPSAPQDSNRPRGGKSPTGIKPPDIKTLPSGQSENNGNSEDEEDFQENSSAAKIMTVVFILAPFIAMVVEHFKLPPIAALIPIAAIILIVFLLKKRS